MLFIIQNDESEHVWHVGNDAEYFKTDEFLATVKEIQADCDELAYIVGKNPGILRFGLGKRSIGWYGSLAAYVVSRL